MDSLNQSQQCALETNKWSSASWEELAGMKPEAWEKWSFSSTQAFVRAHSKHCVSFCVFEYKAGVGALESDSAKG